MTDILALVKDLEAIKAQQKIWNEKEALCKASLLEAMKKEGIEKEDSAYGTVRIQHRQEKDYGPELKAMEAEFKAAKKLKDDLGDYETVEIKDSIVYTAPKELF
jgi:hypothetical protein